MGGFAGSVKPQMNVEFAMFLRFLKEHPNTAGQNIIQLFSSSDLASILIGMVNHFWSCYRSEKGAVKPFLGRLPEARAALFQVIRDCVTDPGLSLYFIPLEGFTDVFVVLFFEAQCPILAVVRDGLIRPVPAIFAMV
jgi:hypothetical protein